VETATCVSPLALIAQHGGAGTGVIPGVGDQVVDGDPIAVGVPLPRHANELVGRLIGIGKPFAHVQEFQQALAASRDKRRKQPCAQVGGIWPCRRRFSP